MRNKSVEQFQSEIMVAKKQALRDPYQYERPDTVVGVGEDANSLTDTVLTRGKLQSHGKMTFPAGVRAHIGHIFDKFPVQLEILGLYYDGGFTTEEIADMRNDADNNILTTLRRAKARLKKYLTPTEYDSIRWAIGDPKSLEATQPRFVNPFYDDFAVTSPVRTGIWGGTMIAWDDGGFSDCHATTPVQRHIQGLHPDPKDLPVPQHVLLDELEAVS